MAVLCGLALPMIAPVMVATGPAAVVLIPLIMIGGPAIACACLVRAFGSRVALQRTPSEVTIRSLWRTARVLPQDLRDVRVDEVVSHYLFIPINKKAYVVAEYTGALGRRRTKRIDLKLVEPDRAEVERIVEALRATIVTQDLSGGPRTGLMQPAR